MKFIIESPFIDTPTPPEHQYDPHTPFQAQLPAMVGLPPLVEEGNWFMAGSEIYFVLNNEPIEP